VNKDSPKNALLVVLVTALVCSSLVSAAVVLLRPIQLNHQLLEKSRNIMQLTGLLAEGNELDDDEMLGLYKSVDRRIVNIDEATFDEVIDPNTFDKRKAVNDPELGVLACRFLPEWTWRAWAAAAVSPRCTSSGMKTGWNG
jgi:Na+-transporting NADH:ubiquinone oxidoreductase subunit NqrC